VAERTNRGIALLSLHPRHAESILSGTKKVEFRRIAFKRDVGYVIVYATAPVCRVVGWFSVKEIESRSPSALWRRHAAVSGVSSKEFKTYFSGTENGVAIRVGQVRRLASPIRLTEVRRSMTAPQSYLYVEPIEFERVAKAKAS
jgi:predicted transcriptional regulator